MSFLVKLSPESELDIEKHRKSGNKKMLVKIDRLLDELREHPTTGTGKPEQLKHYKTPTWSRRISGQHRLVYRIQEEVVTVLILSAWGHYE